MNWKIGKKKRIETKILKILVGGFWSFEDLGIFVTWVFEDFSILRILLFWGFENFGVLRIWSFWCLGNLRILVFWVAENFDLLRILRILKFEDFGQEFEDFEIEKLKNRKKFNEWKKMARKSESNQKILQNLDFGDLMSI